MFENLIPWRHKQEKHSLGGDLVTKPAGSQLARFRDEFGSLLERMNEGDFWSDADRWNQGWACDVEDGEKEIVVRAEAPGFNADEIDVKMSGNRLVLQAEHKEEAKVKNGHSTRYGKYYRTMTVPQGIEADKIKAEYTNGVLEVHLPKGPEAQSVRIPVQAK